jgi:hypothetical protein
MNDFNWKPCAAVAAHIALMLAIGVGLIAFSQPVVGGEPGMMLWGMGGMGFFWIFPVLGLVMMLSIMFIFISIATTRAGPMGWMFGNLPRDAKSRPLKRGRLGLSVMRLIRSAELERVPALWHEFEEIGGMRE